MTTNLPTATSAQPRRSVLYTPGANAKVLAKAGASAADVLIFDLEDAVAPDAKEAARATVRDALATSTHSRKEVVVRVNGLDTPWCAADVTAMADAGAAALLFPKINSADDVARAEHLMQSAGLPESVALWCMIETPLAILNAERIARSALLPGARMSVWVMGTNDLVKDLRAAHTPGREPLMLALQMALLAARAYGLAILDGVHNDIADSDGLLRSCEQGLAFGFDGKTLIHPSQIEVCNRVFSPSADALRQARTIIDAFDQPQNQGKAVLQIEGRMVELLHAEMARRTLAVGAAIEAAQMPAGAS